MKRIIASALIVLLFCAVQVNSQQYTGADGTIQVVVIKDPYTDSRSGPELLKGPDILDNSGFRQVLETNGCSVVETVEITMPAHLERQYGEWNRAAHTNNVINKTISVYDENTHFFIGLLSGSKSLTGMLGGLQHIGPDRQPLKDSMGREIKGLPRLGKHKPLKPGLVWISAKGAFNTPDITLVGEMGDMNLAVAAGMSNYNLRIQAGLDPPVSTKHIVMAGVRDTTPYEEFAIDNSFIERISSEEIGSLAGIEDQMKRLSKLTDIIYVHVDLSVLDPVELPGHSNAVEGGPSCEELARFLEVVFSYHKTAAIGIASMNDNPEDVTIKAANRLIEAALRGIQKR